MGLIDRFDFDFLFLEVLVFSLFYRRPSFRKYVDIGYDGFMSLVLK